MFDQPFLLDAEKIKWMLHRKERLHFNHPHAIEDSAEIWNQLRKDMNEYIEGCNDEELSLLAEDIGDLITEFNETGEGEFVDFLREIAETRGISDLLKKLMS
jgi:predicted house-cleaning noncanonical NTP pyrophosphatase (MazG superfamily)